MLEHAKLSASGASRWMACPGSVALEKLFPDEDTAYSAEGTKAHSVAEAMLLARLYGEVDEYIVAAINEADKDMLNAAKEYADYCMELYETKKLESKDAIYYIEERVHFSSYVPEGFGTIDFVLLTNTTLDIVDFKYGKGVPVYAENNPQLKLYALGALDEFGFIYESIKDIGMHIVQPRINNFSSDKTTAKALKKWACDKVVARAQVAYAEERTFFEGEHCKFCKARACCRFRAKAMVNCINNMTGAN